MDSKLFEGISENDLSDLLKTLGAKKLSCEKNQVAVHQGEHVKAVYVCLDGSFNVENVNLYGEVNIISHISKGGYFGGAFAFSSTPSPADFKAVSAGTVLIIPIKRILENDNLNPCEIKFLWNLTGILARKSTFLITKIQHLTERTIREKVISYLSYESSLQGKNDVVIPFNRQELADYLSVDRSALSKELSAMRADGLIEYRKNKFSLKIQR